jgi:hypothetical protein
MPAPTAAAATEIGRPARRLGVEHSSIRFDSKAAEARVRFDSPSTLEGRGYASIPRAVIASIPQGVSRAATFHFSLRFRRAVPALLALIPAVVPLRRVRRLAASIHGCPSTKLLLRFLLAQFSVGRGHASIPGGLGQVRAASMVLARYALLRFLGAVSPTQAGLIRFNS